MVQTRIAIFYTASAASGAFSGLLAYLISKMDGAGGYEGWRWFGRGHLCAAGKKARGCSQRIDESF